MLCTTGPAKRTDPPGNSWHGPRLRYFRSVLCPPPRRHVQFAVSLFLVYVLWGTTFPAVRVMVAPTDESGLPTFFAAGSRLLLSGSALLVMGATTRPGRAALHSLERSQLSAAVRGGLLLSFGTGTLTALAARHVESGILATLMATAPLWTALLVAMASRRAPRLLVLIGLGLGIGGVLFLSGGSTFTLSPGIAFAIAAALTWSIGSWYTTRASLPAQMWLSVAIGQLFSSGALLLIGAASGELHQVVTESVSLSSWIALGYLGFVSLTGLSAYFWLLRNFNPLIATTHALVNPVVAALIGPLVLDDHLQPSILIAAGMVGTGALLVLSRDEQGARRWIRRVGPA